MRPSLVLLLALAACQAAPPDAPAPDAPAPEAAAPEAAAPEAAAPEAAAPEAAAARPVDPESPEAAADVVRRYYDALDAGDYEAAFALWGEGGPPGQSYDAFVQGFAETAHVAAEVGAPSEAEGAAGSVYVTVPVTVRAALQSGRRQLFTGTYTVRRVHGVPGASAAQRRWHLDAATLHEAP